MIIPESGLPAPDRMPEAGALIARMTTFRVKRGFDVCVAVRTLAPDQEDIRNVLLAACCDLIEHTCEHTKLSPEEVVGYYRSHYGNTPPDGWEPPQ